MRIWLGAVTREILYVRGYLGGGSESGPENLRLGTRLFAREVKPTIFLQERFLARKK